MHYKIVSKILGFNETVDVRIEEIDELFFKMIDNDDENISFILLNPYMLREYEFEIPAEIKQLLEINEESNVSVYTILLIQKPLEKSVINFLAPIVVNEDNKTIAQVVLEPQRYPDFGMAETIESLRENL